jgi:hypothetical protein
MAKYSNEGNLNQLTVLIGRQLRILTAMSDNELLERGLYKVVVEYGKLIILSLREDREQLRSLSIDTMSDEDLMKAVREELNVKCIDAKKE